MITNLNVYNEEELQTENLFTQMHETPDKEAFSVHDSLKFAKFMQEYYFLTTAHDYKDEHMITRLPIYLKGLARDTYAYIMLQ